MENNAPEISPDVADPTVEAMAYLGDAVVELLVRERLVKKGLCDSSGLNREAVKYVKATSQSDAVERVFPMLTEEEQSLYRRGRNAGHGKNTPKSASVIEYGRATGFETIFGALWLKGETRRAKELILLAFPGLR